jgi:arylsulfatase A-like enzyme
MTEPRLRPHAARAIVVAAALASACTRATLPSASPRAVQLRLAERLDEAEIRSDSLDLPFLVADHRLRKPQWQEPQEGEGGLVVWTHGKNADLALPIATGAAKELRIRARCHMALGPRLAMDVLMNAKLLGSVVLTSQDQEFRFEVPSAVQSLPESVLRLSVARSYRPAKGVNALAAAVGVAALELRRFGDKGPVVLPVVTGGRLLLPPASLVGFFLRQQVGAELSLRVAAGKPGARLEATLATKDGRVALGQAAALPVRAVPFLAGLQAAEGTYEKVELANAGQDALTLEDVLVRGLEAPKANAMPSARLSARPSVVIFLVDTLRADRLGAYGFDKPTSPAFDAFARDAVVFDDAWAQASWTRPAVASIFTGLHVSSHGAGGFDRAVPDSLDTMAEVLKRGGYRTGAVVANHVVNARFGFAQGFDSWNDGDPHLYGLSAADAVTRGLKWIDAASAPFFLYLQTLEPHAPYEPSDGSWAPFRPPGTARRPSVPILMRAKISPEEGRYLDSLYQGEVLDDDHAFGALIEGLRSRGLLDSTLVLFTADHGEEFLDHGGKGHGNTLYRELTRVPLAVRLPGGRRGGIREAQPVAQVDLLPTLAALTGVAAPPNEGRDLSSLWLGRARPGEPPELVSETRFGKSEKSALRVGSLKLIVNTDPRRYGSAGGPLELYDLARDPGERHNLAHEDPFAARWLANRLSAILHVQRLGRAARGEARVKLSHEDREKLKALGYVQ